MNGFLTIFGSRERRQRRRRAFTLLEIMIAVVILALTALAIHRFVRGTLTALAVSVDDTEDQLAIERLVALVQEGLYGIPPTGTQTLMGDNLRLNNRNMDWMEWRSRGGVGLMTTAASGEYRVQLRFLPLKDNPNQYEIGLWRRPALLDTAGGLVQANMNDNSDADWVPLLKNVDGMMIRYWDATLGAAQDRWQDPARRPTFVRLSIWRNGDPVPYEACLTVPAAFTQRN